MGSVIKTEKGRKRVRLGTRTVVKPDMTKCNEARDESLRNAPRTESGQLVPAYRYKEILAAYEEHGLEPKQNYGEPNPNAPKPLFLRKPKLGRRVIKLIKEGYPYTTVCRYCGISRDTFISWLVKGREGHPNYIDFFEKVAKAEAQAEINQLKNLRKHESREWKVSAWQLERRWPEHWSKVDRIRAETQTNIEITVQQKENLGEQVAHDETSRELARRLIDGTEFGYSRIEK